jgi:protein SCO1
MLLPVTSDARDHEPGKYDLSMDTLLSKRRPLLFGFTTLLSLALMALVALVLLPTLPRSGASVPDYGPAPQFRLLDQLARPVADTDLRGTVVLANFIYTTCPDICPTTSGQMRDLQERLRAAGLLENDVRLVSITVDPANDTPEQLRRYAESLGADPERWRFLTGDEAAIRTTVIDGFALGITIMPPATTPEHHGHTEADDGAHTGMISHSGRFVLIDRDWQIAGYYESADLNPEEVVRTIQALAQKEQ